MSITPAAPAGRRWLAPVIVGVVALTIGGMAGGYLGSAAAESTYAPQLDAAATDLAAAEKAASAAAEDAASARADLAALRKLVDDTAAKLQTATAGLAAATQDTARLTTMVEESAALGDEMLAAYNAQWSETQSVVALYNSLIDDYNAAVATATATVDAANQHIAAQDAQIQTLGNDLNSMLAIADTQAAQLAEQSTRLDTCNAEIGTLVLGTYYLMTAHEALLLADAVTADANLTLALAELADVTGSC
jgi:chromosome segregation ATPase